MMWYKNLMHNENHAHRPLTDMLSKQNSCDDGVLVVMAKLLSIDWKVSLFYRFKNARSPKLASWTYGCDSCAFWGFFLYLYSVHR